MGTEVESQNSNHRLSQIISETFNFLEGEDDGTANGNDLPSLEREFDGTASGATSQTTGLQANGNDAAVVNGNREGREAGVSERRQFFEVNKPTKGRDDVLKVTNVENPDKRGENCKETGKKTSERIALWEHGVRKKTSRWTDSKGIEPEGCSQQHCIDDDVSTAALLRPPSSSGSLSSSGSISALPQGSDSLHRVSQGRDSGNFSAENCDNESAVLTSETKALNNSDCVQIISGTLKDKTGKTEAVPSLDVTTRSNSELGQTYQSEAELLEQARAIVDEVLSYENLRRALEDIQNKPGETSRRLEGTHVQGQNDISLEGHSESEGLSWGVESLHCGYEGTYLKQGSSSRRNDTEPHDEVSSKDLAVCDTEENKATTNARVVSEREKGDETDAPKAQATSDSDTRDEKDAPKAQATSDSDTRDEKDAPKAQATSDSDTRDEKDAPKAQATSDSDTRDEKDAPKAQATSDSDTRDEKDAPKAQATSDSDTRDEKHAPKAQATSDSDTRDEKHAPKAQATSDSDTRDEKDSPKAQATSDSDTRDEKAAPKAQATSDSDTRNDTDAPKVQPMGGTQTDEKDTRAQATGDAESRSEKATSTDDDMDNSKAQASSNGEARDHNIAWKAQATCTLQDTKSLPNSINLLQVASERSDKSNPQNMDHCHESESHDPCNAESFIPKEQSDNSEKKDSDCKVKPKDKTDLQERIDKLGKESKDDMEPAISPTEPTTPPVVLRRKKSDAKQPNSSSNDGKNSPTASPGTLKRRALRSPLSRLRPVWDYTDIPSDGDSPRQSEDSDDDDDAGIYADSYRNSQWFYLGGATSTETLDIDIESRDSSSSSIFETSPETSMSEILPPFTQRSQSVDPSLLAPSDIRKDDLNVSVDSGLGQSDTMPSPRLYKQNDLPMTLPRRSGHARSDSISTTASEIEFRKRYQAKTKRIVHRQSSAQTYQRMSERFYDDERCLTVEKRPGDTNFGFHIKGSNPVAISTVEVGSAAEAAGVKVSEVVITINDVNVMDASHQEAIKLISQDGERVKLTVASDSKLVSDRPLCSGFLVKQGGSGLLKNWRRRWFILKNDHCLYYYKAEDDKDPLGAILLTNYTITKAPEMNRRHTFKAHKYGQRTYYFQADSEDDMTIWANAMSTAAMATAKTDTWLDISSHNVGLPALSIKSPDCHGYLTKMGNRRKNWKRRYCVLKDACLYYYLEGTSSTAQGVAHLHGYQVDETLPFNKKFGFTLVPPDASMRTFYFFADNETDMKRWLKALHKSIGRWVRADDI